MATKTDSVINYLIDYPEPIIRWKLIRNVLGYIPLSSEYIKARNDLVSSPLIKQLLSNRDIDGRLPYHPYDKWFGAHWVLSIFADRVILKEICRLNHWWSRVMLGYYPKSTQNILRQLMAG
jgi:hypothetical protein